MAVGAQQAKYFASLPMDMVKRQNPHIGTTAIPAAKLGGLCLSNRLMSVALLFRSAGARLQITDEETFRRLERALRTTDRLTIYVAFVPIEIAQATTQNRRYFLRSGTESMVHV